MRRTTPQIRDFAAHLVTHAARGNRSAAKNRPAAFHVCEKLRPGLATLIGNGGFRALLTRALTLARPDAPSLRAVEVMPDGSFADLGERHAQVSAKELAEGGVVLIAELLALLIAFIGENLTVRMVRDAWPQLPLCDFDSVGGLGNDTEK